MLHELFCNDTDPLPPVILITRINITMCANITRFRMQEFRRKYHIINCLKLSLYVLHKSI